MLGLFAFFYAFVHAVTYAALDLGWSLSAILADVTKRAFIALGFGAFVLLAPLAATSTAFAVRRLGFVRWKRLHRLVYVAGVLAVLHFLWRVKLDLTEPLVYSFTLALLFAARLVGGSSAATSGPSSERLATSGPATRPLQQSSGPNLLGLDRHG